MKTLKLFCLTILILNFFFSESFAQKEGNVWYFGNLAGMDFNGGPPVVLNNSVMNAFETSGSIADANGNLLFYTDGVDVFNSNHVVMTNGTGLGGGGSSSQGSLILPMPGSSTLYYIFTIVDGGTGASAFSIVDMSMSGGLGAVTTKNSTMMAANATEKQAAIKHANGSDYWIVQHSMNTNSFYAFILSNTGVSTPVISNSGTINTGVDYGGNMKASPLGNQISASLHSHNAFEIYDFDNATGIVSNALYLGSTYSSAYGVCFSPDGSKLYGSNEGGGAITQWNLSAGSSAAIIASATTIATLTNSGGAIQYGPDNKLYIAHYGSGYLAVVNDPDSLPASCNFSANGFYLNGATSTYGLPLFVSNLFKSSFNYQYTCEYDTTVFTLPSVANMFGAQWDFDDPSSGANNTSTIFNPIHHFTAPGTYMVKVVKYYALYNDTVTKPVTIHATPAINLGSDTSFCTGTSYLLNAGAGFTSYLWQNGSTNSSLTATVGGTYIVTVNDSLCSATDSIVLTEFPCLFPTVNLSSTDTNFCEKKCVDFYDLSTNNPTSWQWFFPGADSTTSTLQNPSGICYNNYGSFDVTLIACNPFGCDTLVLSNFINEYQTPVPVITQSNDTLYSSPGVSYQWWSVSGGLIPGATNYYYVPTQGGDYYVIVGDSVGCAGTSNVITVTGVNEWAIGSGQIAIIPNPNNGSFAVSLNKTIKDFSLRIVNTLGQTIYIYDGSHGQPSWTNGDEPFTISLGNVATGLYAVEFIAGKKIYTQLFVKD